METEGVRGVIIAPLRERHSDRIVVAKATILYLRQGVTCTHALGTTLRIEYTIHQGRYQVDRIEAETPTA